MRLFPFAVAAAVLLAQSASAQTSGQFSGNPVLEFIDEGQARLQSPLSYRDPTGRNWVAPAGIVVDGASIPRAFWTLIGSPFTGNYLKASVIHDYYCDRKTRPWKDVHRVFYDGMISGGVSSVQAKIMYYAVYRFGPRWETRIERVPGRNFSGEAVMVEETITVDLPSAVYNSEQVAEAQQAIEGADLTLEQIEALADSQT